MNIKNVLISLVAGILILILGVWLGMLLGGKGTMTASQTSQVAAGAALTKALSSKVIPSIAAYGQVTKIDGSNLTISYQGDSVVVSVDSNSKIYSFAKQPTTTTTKKTTAPTSQQIALKDVKVGDNVSVNIKVFPTGEMQGLSVVVLPPTPITK